MSLSVQFNRKETCIIFDVVNKKLRPQFKKAFNFIRIQDAEECT